MAACCSWTADLFRSVCATRQSARPKLRANSTSRAFGAFRMRRGCSRLRPISPSASGMRETCRESRAPIMFSTPRLPPSTFDVIPPSDRVEGPRGYMKIREARCRVGATADARRRIVDIAVQEWAFFGSHSVDVSHTQFNALPQGVNVEQQAGE